MVSKMYHFFSVFSFTIVTGPNNPAFNTIPSCNLKGAVVQVSLCSFGNFSSPINRFAQVLVTLISIVFFPFFKASEISVLYGKVQIVPQLIPFMVTSAILAIVPKSSQILSLIFPFQLNSFL